MKEPSGPIRTMVPGQVDGGKSQGGADRLTGRGGVIDSEPQGRARRPS